MSQFIGNKKKKMSLSSFGLDPVLLACYGVLVLIGCAMAYTVGFGNGYTNDWTDFFLKSQAGKQIVFSVVSVILLLFIYLVDSTFWKMVGPIAYGVGIVLLVLVLGLGTVVNGARAWFNFGFFSFQPAEIAKFGTALALSSYLATNKDVRDNKTLLTCLALILGPVFLILLQPDAGSALVFLSFSIMLYREGLSSTPFAVFFTAALVFVLTLMLSAQHVILGLVGVIVLVSLILLEKMPFRLLIGLSVFGLGALGIYFNLYWYAFGFLGFAALSALILMYNNKLWRQAGLMGMGLILLSGLAFSADFAFNNVLRPHQKERINVWLRPDKCDPRGAAYNLVHSKLTIGSGGLTGKGYLEGTMTKLKYVPEQQTDFIFTAIGEEQGFIGVFAVLMIFIVMLWRIISVAERQRSNFVRYYGYCIAGIFFVHLFINVGMTMGIMPIIGIPLPFISAGGSSLLAFTLLLGVFLRLDAADYSV